jgi:septal ring factor EnvC (AmiA/AmiB activator)
MTRMLRVALGSLLVLGAVLPVALPAIGQQKKDSADLGDKEHALQQTQKRLKEERAKAADARKREAGLLSELEAIDRRLSEKRKQVAILDGRIQRSQAEMSELQRDIVRLEGQRSGQEDALAQRLRTMYRLQVQGGALPALLSGDDPIAQAAGDAAERGAELQDSRGEVDRHVAGGVRGEARVEADLAGVGVAGA